MQLSKKLKRLRKHNNCTKKQFANLLGISYTTYQKYETGAVYPRFALLQKICQQFPEHILWLMIDRFDVKQSEPQLKDTEQGKLKVQESEKKQTQVKTKSAEPKANQAKDDKNKHSESKR